MIYIRFLHALNYITFINKDEIILICIKKFYQVADKKVGETLTYLKGSIKYNNAAISER